MPALPKVPSACILPAPSATKNPKTSRNSASNAQEREAQSSSHPHTSLPSFKPSRSATPPTCLPQPTTTDAHTYTIEVPQLLHLPSFIPFLLEYQHLHSFEQPNILLAPSSINTYWKFYLLISPRPKKPSTTQVGKFSASPAQPWTLAPNCNSNPSPGHEIRRTLVCVRELPLQFASSHSLRTSTTLLSSSWKDIATIVSRIPQHRQSGSTSVIAISYVN